jgi:hypothetical protein
MNIEDFCEHTFVRWVEKVATCAVCQKQFPEIRYMPGFIGMFPRDVIVKAQILLPVNSTMTYIPPLYYSLEEE